MVEWRFTNPHAQLIFKATDDNGELAEWTASTGNVNSLIRLGYSAETFEPGQVVTVYGNPARDGTSNMGALQVAIRGGDLVKFSIDDSLISLDSRPVAAPTSEADGTGLTGVWRFIYGPIGPELKALASKDARFVDGYGQAPGTGRRRGGRFSSCRERPGVSGELAAQRQCMQAAVTLGYYNCSVLDRI